LETSSAFVFSRLEYTEGGRASGIIMVDTVLAELPISIDRTVKAFAEACRYNLASGNLQFCPQEAVPQLTEGTVDHKLSKLFPKEALVGCLAEALYLALFETSHAPRVE